MRTFIAFLICLGIYQNMSGQVENYEIDPAFNTGDFYTKGNIFNLFITGNENVIVCGGFSVSSTIAGGWSIIGNDGNIIYNATTQDIGPNIVEPYLSKYITSGPSMYLRNEDATADYSFRFEFQKPAYGGFISSAVNDILVMDDSLLIVGGIFFTDSTDISPNSLRQLCMIDSTGAPVPGFPMVKCEPIDARIFSIDTLSNGEYIIGGRFSSVNGHPTNNIAKLHSDYSVDTSFVSPLGDDGTAFIQYVDSSDRLWLAVPGGFIESMPNIFPGLIRVLPDGALDMSFNIPQIKRVVNGIEINAYSGAKIQDVDGTYIVGGVFTSYNGYEKHGLIKINDDGSLIPGAFANLGVDAATWDGYTSDYPGIGPIEKLPDGKLLLGGSFSSFGGESYNCLVRLKPAGYVGVDTPKKPDSDVKIYPSPADGFLTISYNLLHSKENTVLNIYDNLARKVYSAQLGEGYQGEKLIDTRKFTNGVYILEIRQDDIQVEVNKFVVTH